MSDEARRAFVETLRTKRLRLGLRQRDVALRAGVHGNTVGKWELGHYWPSASHAEAWAKALGVAVVGGDLAELFPVPGPPPCGTAKGYRRHNARGERCPECWAAWSVYIGALKKRGAKQ